MKRINIYIISLIFISVSYGQLDYRLAVESGMLRSENVNSIAENDLLSKLDFSLAYKADEFRSKIKIQPAFLSFKIKPKALKLKTEINYYKRTSDLNYGFYGTYQLNKYYEGQTFNLSKVSLSGLLAFPFSTKSDIDLKLIYTNQNIKFLDEQKINRFTGLVNYNYYMNRYIQIGGGFYFDLFDIESPTNALMGFRSDNSGYRIGPRISFNFLKSFVLKFNYRYVYQKTEIFSNGSYEHNLRFIAGKIFASVWSLFILVDYTKPEYDFGLEEYNDKNLLYVSSNFENNYYLKLSRKFSKKLSLYTKIGYFNESIRYLNYDYKGWSFTAGVEIK